MRFPIVPLLLLCASIHAQTVQDQYQAAVLVSFKTVSTGSDCSSTGTTTGRVNDNGNIKADSDSTSSCSDSEVRLYTVRVGENLFVLRPASAFGGPTPGWVSPFKRCSLANQLPGTHILIRSHGSGLQVKVGTKESSYTLYGAQ